MNRFKTYEIIKLLEEHPKSKYKDSKNRIIENVKGKVVVTFEGTFESLDINETWTQCQEPTFFIDAVNSGKKIRFDDIGSFHTVQEILNILTEEYFEEQIINKLNKKCWYVNS
ncbi:hypothetical protein [Clostridium brassicae]|uniref:Large polyvalent protein associated domain-containing protein n=1 Tax=Clostridium brassicae TaxID=2999072 RepID=A0ABT4D956_9CLOT|nr:hypothetical protein [Clostridium brassicae]MCY6958843.1 hypothetical protein [Clostridium brassicae]